MNYRVEIVPAARREIKKLTQEVQFKVICGLEKLKENARPKGVEKLQGYPCFFRMVVDDHRIIYHVRGDVVIVLVVRDRKNAYKSLGSLDHKLFAAVEEIASVARGSFLGG